MLEIALLRAATRAASLGLGALCLVGLVACGDGGGNATATAPSRARGTSGGFAGSEVAEADDHPPQDAGADSWFVPLKNARSPLTTPTYDGSDQAVEPTVLLFPNGWRGHHYWMAMSPYPQSNASYENPSILVSEDGLSWSVPQGLQNPLVEPDRGALADATIVYDDASDQLWMYYLEELRDGGGSVGDGGAGDGGVSDSGVSDGCAGEGGRGDGGSSVHWQLLRRMTSDDGVHWSPWTQLLEGTPYPLESASVVKKGDEFLMWTVDVAAGGCTAHSSNVLERSSRDGIHWTEPAVTGITIPGYVVFHVNMTQIGSTGRLLGAITAFRQGTSCHQTELFLAYTEGDRWVTVPKALLSPNRAHTWDDRLIYRSSFLYDEPQDLLRVWYSAQTGESGAWHLGYTEGKLVLPQ